MAFPPYDKASGSNENALTLGIQMRSGLAVRPGTIENTAKGSCVVLGATALSGVSRASICSGILNPWILLRMQLSGLRDLRFCSIAT